MNIDFYAYLVLFLALVLANLPFVNQRLLLVFPLKDGLKPLWIRMAELLLFFFIAGAISLGIEASLGQIYPQSWQFYVVGLSLFLVFAFPGFVIRYMLLKRG